MKYYKFIYLCAAVLFLASCSSTNRAEKKMLANTDPYTIGSVIISTDPAFSSSLKDSEIEVIFDPRENEVILSFSLGMAQHRQIWNEEGRKLFIDALAKYKEDFANQRLNSKDRKSGSIYGRAKGKFQWQPMKISATYYASPFYDLGYRFKENSPFFTIYQIQSAETGHSNSGITKSPQYYIYFTRAEAEELARVFDQAFLLRTLSNFGIPLYESPERDVYVEKQY